MTTSIYTVYKTTNILNGKIYIGVHKTSNPDDSYLGSGKLLLRSINKYGRENFVKEILFIFNDKESAYNKEKSIVNEKFILKTTNYNLKEGGIGGLDEKHILRGKNHPWYGRKHTKESKKKISQSKTGISNWTDEAKVKLSNSISGNKNYKYKGDYITPWGTFHSTTAAVDKCDYLISPNSIEKWCKNNHIIISNKMYNGSIYLRKNHDKTIFGKTFSDIGFNFSPK